MTYRYFISYATTGDHALGFGNLEIVMDRPIGAGDPAAISRNLTKNPDRPVVVLGFHLLEEAATAKENR